MLVSHVLSFSLATLNMIRSLSLQIVNSLFLILTIPVICKIDSQDIQYLYPGVQLNCTPLQTT